MLNLSRSGRLVLLVVGSCCVAGFTPDESLQQFIMALLSGFLCVVVGDGGVVMMMMSFS